MVHSFLLLYHILMYENTLQFILLGYLQFGAIFINAVNIHVPVSCCECHQLRSYTKHLHFYPTIQKITPTAWFFQYLFSQIFSNVFCISNHIFCQRKGICFSLSLYCINFFFLLPWQGELSVFPIIFDFLYSLWKKKFKMLLIIFIINFKTLEGG